MNIYIYIPIYIYIYFILDNNNIIDINSYNIHDNPLWLFFVSFLSLSLSLCVFFLFYTFLCFNMCVYVNRFIYSTIHFFLNYMLLSLIYLL